VTIGDFRLKIDWGDCRIGSLGIGGALPGSARPPSLVLPVSRGLIALRGHSRGRKDRGQLVSFLNQDQRLESSAQPGVT
jgi:hypothetical protein